MMRFQPLSAVFLTLFLFVSMQSLHADDQEILKKVTSGKMKALLVGEGYEDVTIDSDDDLVVRMNGYRVLIFVRFAEYSRIQFSFALSGTNATLESVNKWNQDKLYGRMYLDGDGDPALKMDLDMAGGVTIARIRDAIMTFSQLQKAFIETL